MWVAGSGFRVAGSWVLGFLACVAVQNPEPREPREPKEPATRYPEPATRFVFRNNFWVNLHHVLDAEAHRRDARAPMRVKLEELAAAERATWSAALDAYRVHAQHNLIADPLLIRINNALTETASDAALPDIVDGADTATRRALVLAAPIYRAHYWTAQRELNDRWIATLHPMLADRADAMIATVERAYDVRWPVQPIIVDACAEAPPFGGYTTAGPPGTAGHTVIEAANPEYQGDMAFEMLFHEASHTSAVGGRLFNAIRASAARQQVETPPDLFHVVVFYTAGELARRALGKVGDEHYMPYGYRYDVYSRGWQSLRDAVVHDWHPHLDGTVSFSEAVDAVVREATKRP
jgi:hypothetical protein